MANSKQVQLLQVLATHHQLGKPRMKLVQASSELVLQELVLAGFVLQRVMPHHIPPASVLEAQRTSLFLVYQWPSVWMDRIPR